MNPIDFKNFYYPAYNGNGGMTAQQAATVLNWNPKHLDIKTRSVEKTLEPLVLQVTTLVSSSATGEFVCFTV